MSKITKYLPKKELSRLVGKIAHWRGPSWWAQLTIMIFSHFYRINLSEMDGVIQDYPSLGEFFIRRLKPGIRPIGESPIVHPVDGVITQSGLIQNGSLIQAKGMSYTIEDLTLDKESNAKWGNGYFTTYYLCPTDYHRVHSPADGEIVRVRHISGELWPVNEWSTQHIKGLFAKNERIVVELLTELGPLAVVFVGATNVGSIELAFDPEIYGNNPEAYTVETKKYEKLFVKKGDELGWFRMGSTVVNLFPSAFIEKINPVQKIAQRVRVNENY